MGRSTVVASSSSVENIHTHKVLRTIDEETSRNSKHTCRSKFMQSGFLLVQMTMAFLGSPLFSGAKS